MKQKLIDLSFVFLLFFIGLLMAEFHAWAVNKFLIPEFYRIFKNGYWSTFWGSGAKWSLVGLVFKMLLIWIPFMFVGTLLFIFNSNDSKIKTWATWILLIFFWRHRNDYDFHEHKYFDFFLWFYCFGIKYFFLG